MQATLRKPAETIFKIAAPGTHKTKIMYWIATALFCLEMTFTAYAELRLPQVAAAFTHLGFPDYFRVELSGAKLIGVVLMLVPAQVFGNSAQRRRTACALREWVYAGFAIDLASALIAHWSVGDGFAAWVGRRQLAFSGASPTSRGAASRRSRQANPALLAP